LNDEEIEEEDGESEYSAAFALTEISMTACHHYLHDMLSSILA
jgi:hypothetical protein